MQKKSLVDIYIHTKMINGYFFIEMSAINHVQIYNYKRVIYVIIILQI